MTDYSVSNGRVLDLKDSIVNSGWKPQDPVNTTDALLSADKYYLIVFRKSNKAAVWLMKEVQGAFFLLLLLLLRNRIACGSP